MEMLCSMSDEKDTPDLIVAYSVRCVQQPLASLLMIVIA